MDEKLVKVLSETICGITYPNNPNENDAIPCPHYPCNNFNRIEQAFKDAGYVKLSSEDELTDMLEVATTKASYAQSMYHLRGEQRQALAQELLKLLKGEKR